MIILKTAVSAAAVALLMGGAVIATTAPAAARVVCNDSGDCWHTDARYSYPGRGFTRHNDDWYFHQQWTGDNQQRHYRDSHEGRGYYKSGLWIGF